jgi:hypothetical protein
VNCIDFRVVLRIELTVSRAKMKKWFEKWSAEKARRKEKNLPSIVEYRDETYVSPSSVTSVQLTDV